MVAVADTADSVDSTGLGPEMGADGVHPPVWGPNADCRRERLRGSTLTGGGGPYSGSTSAKLNLPSYPPAASRARIRRNVLGF